MKLLPHEIQLIKQERKTNRLRWQQEIANCSSLIETGEITQADRKELIAQRSEMRKLMRANEDFFANIDCFGFSS